MTSQPSDPKDLLKYDPERLEELRVQTRKRFPQHPENVINAVLELYLHDTDDFDKAVLDGFQSEVLDKFTVDDDGYINLTNVNVIKAGTKEHADILKKIAEDVSPTDPEQPSGSGPTPEDGPNASEAVLEIREQDDGEQ